MLDRRSLLRYTGAGALGAVALTAVAEGTTPAFAADHEGGPRKPFVPMPDPAATPVPNPPYPRHLTDQERRNLKTFDELDFTVFTHQQWSRLSESHSATIRVHSADGSYTDGLEAHIAALQALFAFAPDTRILEHPIRIAKNELTAVTGVMRGTFTQPFTTPTGAVVPPNGNRFAIDVVTVGTWNGKGVMDEEWLFWDNLTFFRQLGLA